MKQPRTYLRHKIECPERKGETELLSDWQTEDGIDILKGISCNNPRLRDLSGTDCQWSCWKQISQQNP